MHHYIAKIEHQPAFPRLTFNAAAFLEIFFQGFEHAFGQRIEHAVTGAVAQYEIIGKVGDIFNIEQENVFALFVLQGFDDLMGKFESVQVSPQFGLDWSGAEYKRV